MRWMYLTTVQPSCVSARKRGGAPCGGQWRSFISYARIVCGRHASTISREAVHFDRHAPSHRLMSASDGTQCLSRAPLDGVH